MKTILFLLSFLIFFSVQAVTKQKIDTVKAKETVAKIDSCVVQIAKLDTGKINDLIDLAEMEDSTKAQLKDIMDDVPVAAQQADDIIKMVQDKENYSSTLEWLLYLVGVIVGFLTFLAGLVKKIRALPASWSPIYWFDKIFGHGKTKTKGLKDLNGDIIPDGMKADIKKIVIPEGYEAKLLKLPNNV